MIVRSIVTAVLGLAVTFSPLRAAAQPPPEFDEAYWQNQKELGRGKLRRGIAGGVLGLGSVALTSFFIVRATEDPQRYLAFSLVSAAATIGMTGHGFSSIALGKREMDRADAFVQQYQDDPASVDADEELRYTLASRKKSTGKLILFGSVLAAQSAVLLANGIVLSVRKSRGADLRGARIWPSFVLGGVLLPGAVSIIALQSRRRAEINGLQSQAHARAQTSPPRVFASWQPYFNLDRRTGNYDLGMVGNLSF